MEGAVQRAGDRVRINVQLIDAQTDEHLWAEIYDRPLTTENLFDIQSEISEAIAAALRTTLSPEESQRIHERPTESLAAYNAYLRARRAFGQREIAAMEMALTEFRRAVEIDPEFAEAWAGIAQVTMVQSSWTATPLEEAIQQATPALQRALELAPDSGEVVLAEAMALEGEDGEVAFQRAIELMPGDPRAYQWYANSFEDDLEREQEGLALLRKAIELDPLDPLFRHQVARHLSRINHFPEAERELRIALDLDPGYFPARQWMDFVMAGQGRLDEAYYWAEQATEADPNSPFTGIGQLFIAVDLQDRPRLEALVKALQASDSPGWQQALGELALAALDRRYDAMLEIISGFEGSPFEDMLADIRTQQHALLGQWPEVVALQRAATPGFFEPEAQREAIADKPTLACVVGYALRRTGDEELGTTLIESTIDYGLNELSGWVRHADQRIDLPICQAAAGRMEEALEALEARFSNGGYQGWMFYRDLEPFEPLLGDPRFEALMQNVETEMERQRSSLAKLVPVEAGP
jgi:tetratricopeptide (TPR) repeat protein